MKVLLSMGVNERCMIEWKKSSMSLAVKYQSYECDIKDVTLYKSSWHTELTYTIDELVCSYLHGVLPSIPGSIILRFITFLLN